MRLTYYLLDVFTRHRLEGNPLAVVMDADGLSDARMQRIAGEFNLSETVFVHTPSADSHVASLRIFTPRVELEFAGHPTIGAAVLLGLKKRSSAIRLEERIGLITAVMERIDARSGSARFALPKLPDRAGEPPPLEDIARSLGLLEDEIGFEGFVPEVWSAGNLFYTIPVRDRDALARIVPERRGWPDVFTLGRNAVYVFTRTPEERENDFAARMFAPGMGLGEDPATGSAAAALCGALAQHCGISDGQASYVLRQGHEMGRPSTIRIQMKLANSRLTHAGIGGEAVILAEGVLDLGE